MNGAPRFFVLGAGRSGTSILQALLSRHPGLLVSHELRVLELAVLAGALFDHGGKTEIDERAPRSAAGLALGLRFVARLGEEQLRAAGKPDGVYADKYPPYCEQLSFLDRLWPHARFVHILRDGRDVVASALTAYMADRGWRRTSEVPSVEANATHWARQVRAARAYAAKLPSGRYLEISYEDLTVDSAAVLARVLRFVGLEPAANHAAIAAQMRPGRTWRDTLSIQDLAQFESVVEARELNAELGYPPTSQAVTASWSAALETPRQWADAGDAACRAGDEARALFCWSRAIRGKSKDPRGALGLLGQPGRPESLFAALSASSWTDRESRAALARWCEARGLDRAAALAVFGLGSGAER